MLKPAWIGQIILLAVWVKPLFWDGRSATLEDQAAGPITASGEMNGKFPVNIDELIATFNR